MNKFEENLRRLAETNIQVVQKPILFNDKKINELKLKEISEMDYLVDNLIVKGYHTFIFGAAGSGKTTILMHLCREMVKKDETIIIHYLYLDGALSFAREEYILNKDLGYENAISIVYDLTSNELQETINSLIATKTNLENNIFMLDTYKFLSADINNKNSNKKAMHLIKGLQRLGATFISLGHTNKDGKNFSGTAEIEQDSDGVLKIDSTQEGDYIISTIDRGGRCRYEVIPKTFKFKGGSVHVEEIKDKVDVGAINKYKEQYNKDIALINAVKYILEQKAKPLTQSELVKLCKDDDEFIGVGINKTKELLIRYEGKEWSVTRDKTNKNRKLYVCNFLNNSNNSNNLNKTED